MCKHDTLCWTCKNATCAKNDVMCPWFNRGKSVPGWNASKHGNSYHVYECPLFEKDTGECFQLDENFSRDMALNLAEQILDTMAQDYRNLLHIWKNNIHNGSSRVARHEVEIFENQLIRNDTIFNVLTFGLLDVKNYVNTMRTKEGLPTRFELD